jgi:hypothetical protein|nr:MAG TPA: hypothetical protein [Caudoviricetes sp.]
MFKFKKRKRKEICNIAETAVWKALNEVGYTEKIGKKYPDNLCENNSLRLTIGNFYNRRDLRLFTKQFRKFAADFARMRGRCVLYHFYEIEENDCEFNQ